MKNDNNKNSHVQLTLIIQQITMFLIILLMPHYYDNIPLIVALIINNISILILFISVVFIKNNINKYKIISLILNFIVFFILLIYVFTLSSPLSPTEMNHSVLDYSIVNQKL